MKTIAATIGGQPHTIAELPAARNAQWRRQFGARVSELLEIVEKLPSVTLNTTDDLVRVVREMLPTILSASDILSEAVIAYDLAMADAYESETMSALPGVLMLGFPFVGLARPALRATTGGSMTMTGMS